MPLLRLEEFADPDPPLTPETGEEDTIRMAAYEEGYAAGWEDAASAHADARAEREAEVARHLQVLSFGYHEARAHVLRAMEPLLVEVATRLLPATVQSALGPAVLDALMPFAERLADGPVTLLVSPGTRPELEAFVAAQTALPIQIVEDAGLTAGQVTIGRGDEGARVDLDRAVVAVTDAIRAFFELQMERSNVG